MRETPLSEHLDLAAVREVVERYFAAVDGNDWDLLASCFTANSEVHLNHGTADEVVLRGPQAVVREYRRLLDERVPRMHAAAHVRIAMLGDSATGDTWALAHLGVPPPEAGRMLVRGLRYGDEFVREAGVWKLSRRRHHALWQYEVAIGPPALR